jgi:hypothetical protein
MGGTPSNDGGEADGRRVASSCGARSLTQCWADIEETALPKRE